VAVALIPLFRGHSIAPNDKDNDMSVSRSVHIGALDVSISVSELAGGSAADKPARAEPDDPDDDDAAAAAAARAVDRISRRFERFMRSNAAVVARCSADQVATMFACVSVPFARECVSAMPSDAHELRRAMARVAAECGHGAVAAELRSAEINDATTALAHLMDHIRLFALNRCDT
jgi:hypothetical protein